MTVVRVGIKGQTQVVWAIKLMGAGGRLDWVEKGERKVHKNCASDLDGWRGGPFTKIKRMAGRVSVKGGD